MALYRESVRENQPAITYQRFQTISSSLVAIGLTIVAIIPIFFNGIFGASVSFGGTSIIIIVGVVIETLKQIESQMRVRNYKGFLND